MSAAEAYTLCNSDVQLIQLKQQWSVQNCSSLVKLCKPQQCLRSASFKHHEIDDVSWQLCLYPGGKREENSGYVSLFLKMYAPPAKDVCIKAEYRLFFLGDDGSRKFTNINVGEFYSRQGKRGFGWGLRNLPRQKVLSALRSDGSLHILCEVDVLPDLGKVPTVNHPVNHPQMELTEIPKVYVANMKEIFRSGRLTDLTVRCAPREFRVHLAILGAQSDVFQAMFESEMTEQTSRTINITDFSAEAVEQMLEYIYIGTAPMLQNHAEDLLGLSEKYGLAHLKAMSEKELGHRVNKENVCQTIAIADMYNATALKELCFNFVFSHRNAVLSSDSWRELKEQNSHLCTEILEKLIGVSTADEGTSSSGPPAKRLRLATPAANR